MPAIVTGASSGIGRAISRHLELDHGMSVMGVSRRGPGLRLDLRTPDALGKILSQRRRFDVAVLNAGMMSFDEGGNWESIFQLNFQFNWLFLEAQRIRETPIVRGGSIIINASVAGVTGDEDMPFYAALKAALINLTKSYAKSLMSQEIKVNCFSCGFFKTNLAGDDPTPQHLIDRIPMGREAEPEEILPIIDALIDCRYITGQNIIVDGGLSL